MYCYAEACIDHDKYEPRKEINNKVNELRREVHLGRAMNLAIIAEMMNAKGGMPFCVEALERAADSIETLLGMLEKLEDEE